MKQRIVRGMLVSLVLVLAVVGLPTTVFAHNGVDHGSDGEARQHAEEAKERAAHRLDDTKKKVCENRANNIQALMDRSVKRAENHQKMFSSISERVKKVFDSLPDGNLANKDGALEKFKVVQDTEVKLLADLETLKAKAVFSCDSDGPKDQIKAFQDTHRIVIQDLKDFRAAVKDFIAMFKQGEDGQ